MEGKNVPSSSAYVQWVRGSCLGKGSFGTVSLAVSKYDGRIFAVKSVNSTIAPPSHIESLENEIRILKSFSSPFVIDYLGDDLSHESSTATYRNLYLEYMPGGTVADMAIQFGFRGFHAEEDVVRSYTRCILSALEYVHSKGFVHCDVKGKNVLVGSTPGVAKLADFGSAKRISGGFEETTILPRGTPLWMAPEVIRQEKQGPESDVWSLGCTVIEMITGRSPWQDFGPATMLRIGFSHELPEFPAQLSELGCDFLHKCLRREPSERWTCKQLLQHPFVLADIVVESSPRSVLDWSNSEFRQIEDEDQEEEIQFSRRNSHESNSNFGNFANSAKGRIRELGFSRGAIWESEGWEVVRSGSVCDGGEEAECSGEEGREGTNWEYSNLDGTNREQSAGISWEYSNFTSDRVESEGINSAYLNSVCFDRLTSCLCGCKPYLCCQQCLEKKGILGVNGEKNSFSCCKCKLLILVQLLAFGFHFILHFWVLLTMFWIIYGITLKDLSNKTFQPSL